MAEFDWDLYGAVSQFARLGHHFSEGDLEKPWAWKDYDDGVRHSFFRTYEELRELAAVEAARRARLGKPLSIAQRILAQYHSGFRDLQAILIGLSDQEAASEPEEGGWPVQQVVGHTAQAERTFLAITQDALERVRSQDGRPLEMSDDAYELFIQGDRLEELMESGAPLSQWMAYYNELHERVLAALVDIRDDELQTPCVYWETKPMPVQFRLLRFDSHLRQHTIQVEKILGAIGHGPNEAQRLIRIVYAALAELEAARLGIEPEGNQVQVLARGLAARTEEIRLAVASL
jgi:uncharacterized damage-inducible protein DinB